MKNTFAQQQPNFEITFKNFTHGDVTRATLTGFLITFHFLIKKVVNTCPRGPLVFFHQLIGLTLTPAGNIFQERFFIRATC